RRAVLPRPARPARRAVVGGGRGAAAVDDAAPAQPARRDAVARARPRRPAPLRAGGGGGLAVRGVPQYTGRRPGGDMSRAGTPAREPVAVGIRIKTGRAIAVALAGTAKAPRFLARCELLLHDPDDPASYQPWHAALDQPPARARAIVARLSEVV